MFNILVILEATILFIYRITFRSHNDLLVYFCDKSTNETWGPTSVQY